MKFAIVLAAVLGFALAKPTNPWFGFDGSELHIHYPDGHIDIAPMKALKPLPVEGHEIDSTSYSFSGYLKGEKGVRISLNRNPENTKDFTVTLNSQGLNHYSYKVVAGKTIPDELSVKDTSRRSKLNVKGEAIPIPGTLKGKYDVSLGDAKMHPKFNKNLPQGCPNCPTYEIIMHSDQTFFNFAGSANAVSQKLTTISNDAQTVFSWDRLSGCADMTLDIKSIKIIDGSYKATSNDLNEVSALSSANSDDVNAYSYIVYDHGLAGTIGIGWVGSVCSIKYYRSTIVEWYDSDYFTSITFSHELGHNLGMDHDFNQITGGNKYSSDGQLCTNVGGVMDYNQRTYDEWSACSLEDFQDYVKQVYAATGTYCMRQTC